MKRDSKAPPLWRVSIWCVLLVSGVISWAQLGRSLLHRPAPPFTRPDLNGTQIDLAVYRGRVILLNFWATWCGPCQVELPEFAKWQKEYGPQGFQVIAISMDDDPAPVRAMARRLEPNFPIVMGDEQLGTEYGGVLGLPVTYLIDRDGSITARFGGATNLKHMEREARKLLAQR